MRNNNIEQNSLPNNSSQTDNTLFLLSSRCSTTTTSSLKRGKPLTPPPHKGRPELGAYPGHHISLSLSQANPNSNPIKESSSSRSKVATTTTTKEKCLPRPTSREPPHHSFFLQRFRRGIHSQPTSTDRQRERRQQTNAAPPIHKKKTNTTPNSVIIHAQQTKLKTNPHLQNKCRKFFKSKALDFRVPRRPKPQQQQKQGLLKAGKQAREWETKRGKNKAPNGKYKHDDKKN
jgi:hypothetical protein